MSQSIKFFCDLCEEEIIIHQGNYGFDAPQPIVLRVVKDSSKWVRHDKETCVDCRAKLIACYDGLKKRSTNGQSN